MIIIDFLDPQVDPSPSSSEAIFEASENDHTEIVKVLLEDSRVDPSAGDSLSPDSKVDENIFNSAMKRIEELVVDSFRCLVNIPHYQKRTSHTIRLIGLIVPQKYSFISGHLIIIRIVTIKITMQFEWPLKMVMMMSLNYLKIPVWILLLIIMRQFELGLRMVI